MLLEISPDMSKQLLTVTKASSQSSDFDISLEMSQSVRYFARIALGEPWAILAKYHTGAILAKYHTYT